MNKKKLAMMLLLTALTTAAAYAQGNGMAGINEATKMVTSYLRPGYETHLCHRCRSGSYRRNKSLQ